MTRSLRILLGAVLAATTVGLAGLTPVIYVGITLDALG